MIEKTLDLKLKRLHADPLRCKDFILADAKDADMALAIGAPGKSPKAHSGELRYRSLQEFRNLAGEIVHQGLVDIMLMTVSTSEVLTIRERLFDNSSVTPAIRANDTTDIWLAGGTGGSNFITNTAATTSVLTIDGDINEVYSGLIGAGTLAGSTDNVALVLASSNTGTLTLNRSAGNTYSGGTTINGGRLLVSGDPAVSPTGSGSVAVNNGGTQKPRWATRNTPAAARARSSPAAASLAAARAPTNSNP